MAQEFRLPDLGEGIHEGEITQVLVSEGATVTEDQPILEVETDKAAVEIPSPYAGTIARIHVKQGDLVQVGDLLITFDGAETARADTGPEKEKAVAPKEPAKQAPKGREGPVAASPATRRLARELGVDLQAVPGSGPAGLVTAEDVRAFATQGAAEAEVAAPPPEEVAVRPEEPSAVRPSTAPIPPLPDFSRWGEVEREPLRSVRRSTAKHMALAWSQIPHVTHQDVADITQLEALRRKQMDDIAEQGGSLTLTVFVMKAAVAALKAYPHFNASLDADCEEIILKHYFHIGVAVDTERGLLVPVVRDVDRKSIAELAVELPHLVERTRSGEAKLEEMQGGTFTITNPGHLGGAGFAPIINYPEVAILGMAQARWQPVVQGEEGRREIVARLLLPLVLAFDHRVVDGAEAARFTTTLIRLLENPDKLLLRV
jgi:pyruvate dehydrogenase E2 component (dihydrolipoyllysine-residue acetyltransferase)